MMFTNIKIVILYKYFDIKSRNISNRHNENNNRRYRDFWSFGPHSGMYLGIKHNSWLLRKLCTCPVSMISLLSVPSFSLANMQYILES